MKCEPFMRDRDGRRTAQATRRRKGTEERLERAIASPTRTSHCKQIDTSRIEIIIITPLTLILNTQIGGGSELWFVRKFGTIHKHRESH